MEHSQSICVKKVKGKGRGVFAKSPIKKGSVIERVPVVLVPINQLVGGLQCPILTKYFYLWGKNTVAISLGYGSLYNHSYTPNAEYRHGDKTISYVALRDIDEGEEITVNYNGDPKSKGAVGFKVL